MNCTRLMEPNSSDLEKGSPPPKTKVVLDVLETASPASPSIWERLVSAGVEERGFTPVPVEERTSRKYHNIFSMWFCLSVNLLPVTTGMVGTLIHGLSLQNASLVILFFGLSSFLPAAFFSTFGPKTGMRQMVHARFSFGPYLVKVVILLNLATLTGFAVMNVVIGGQTLSAVSSGSLSIDVGIVIMAVLALIISFCGYRVLHFYERYAWVPAIVAIIIAVGCGGEHLSQQVAAVEPVKASAILSFGGLIAGYMMPWATVAADFSTYFHHEAPSWRITLYTYFGMMLPTPLLMILGAAIGGAVPNVDSWMTEYQQTGIGGIMAAMLTPAGGFGKFVLVIVAFSFLGNLAAAFYSSSLNYQMLIPKLFSRVPRAIFAIITAAVIIPVGIKAAVSFFSSLQNFIDVVGYWTAAFVAVILVEHFVFRRGRFAEYSILAWDDPSRLPWGVAALVSAAMSFALVIPSMDQAWYTGPIANTTGDIGFEMAFAVTSVLYIPLRMIEKTVSGR